MKKSPCICVPGLYDCGDCTRKLREKIWKGMSEDKKNYDRHFDPGGSRALDNALHDYDSEEPSGCSCHINPPCSYCVNLKEDDEALN